MEGKKYFFAQNSSKPIAQETNKFMKIRMTNMLIKGEELGNKPNWQTGQTHWSSYTNSEEKMFLNFIIRTNETMDEIIL